MSKDSLINKYRPKDINEVLGNDIVLDALANVLASPARPHAFLLIGPSGVGKTTTGRIIAKRQNALLEEVDAATHSSVAEVRVLVETSHFKPLIGEGPKVLIIDECHALSKNAVQALLKLIEEPPPWLTICLCTTEPKTLPETILTRCYRVVLRRLRPSEIEYLIRHVAEQEGWRLPDDVVQALVKAATGQPRKALSMLQAVHNARNSEEVALLLGL